MFWLNIFLSVSVGGRLESLAPSSAMGGGDDQPAARRQRSGLVDTSYQLNATKHNGSQVKVKK